jgi:cobaltochelatase CobS
MSSLPVKLWNASDAPRVDPMYVVNAGDMAMMVASCERGENVWLGGPAGTGKSTMPEQYAARTSRPLVAISFSRAIDQVEIIGQAWLTGAGKMEWRDGVLTAALRKPGTVIVLDEIMAAPPGMLFVIQTLLSYRYMLIHSTGERVECAAGVTFVCADNTMGYGDETGMYAGTMIGNAALVDRMAAMIRVDYLPADIEAQALANHTGAARPACDRVVAFVNGARKLPGFESRPLSLRRMVAFVNKVADGFSIPQAFEVAFLSRLPDAEREALRSHVRANFASDAFDAEMSGRAVAPKSDAPAQVGARNTFDPVE